MPINKIRPTKRAKSAIGAVLALVSSVGGVLYVTTNDGEKDIVVPAAVELAVDSLIIPWEQIKLVAYWDPYGKVWTVCAGETNGIKKGDTFTYRQCKQMAYRRVTNDYYAPLKTCITGFEGRPIGFQAAMISGAYNFGIRTQCKSTQARLAREGKLRQSCEAQTAYNTSNHVRLEGLARRREMGDAQRIGEAELCLSSLKE